MSRGFCLWLIFALVFGLALSGVALGSDPDLVGWWGFDDGAGTIATDASDYGNDGTLMGDPQWVEGYFLGALEFDGTDDYIEVPHDTSLCADDEVTLMMWANLTRNQYPSAGYQGLMSKSNNPRSYSLYTNSSSVLHFSTNGTGTTSSAEVPLNEWVHLVAEVDNGTHRYYINGEDAGSDGSGVSLPGENDTDSVLIGRTPEDSRFVGGLLDDVRIYRRGLSQEEVLDIMTGRDIFATSASNPQPGDGADDVARDSALTWLGGLETETHNVYLGTTFEDVNNASVDNPLGVLVSEGLIADTFDPDGLLEIGQTYYWRVDEVSGAPEHTLFKGKVWSFTSEPLAYPIADVAVTSNASLQADSAIENIVNGSGLDENGQHSVEADEMFAGDPNNGEPIWLLFEFDRVYKLNEMQVWNYNVIFEYILGWGVKDATVEYSIDGTDWTVLGDVEFAAATCTPDYAANTLVDFGGVAVRYVRLTINDNWGERDSCGLSEVRFMYIPAQAREPEPADGATDVDPSTALDWRVGRDAIAHEIYVSTDEQAVSDGTALIDTVEAKNYPIDMLEFGTTYYWKVNEVQDVDVWESAIWTFGTMEFRLIEGFEAYNDDDNRIYEIWTDGWVNNTRATVGYIEAPFAEQTIVVSGRQSMPLQYDNGVSPFYAEAERIFATAQDWTINGADSLQLNFCGYPTSFVEAADGTITIGAGGADIYDGSDEFRFVYKQLSGDGTIIARVDSLYNSSEWAKTGVMIRESLMANASYAMTIVTPTNGVAFQRRTTSGGNGATTTVADIAAPYWVKLTRTGDLFTAQYSADGVTWTDFDAGDVTIPMSNSVYIGLALTSHNTSQMTSADISNVSTTGAVTGQWQDQAIGVEQPSNDADSLYVTVKDTAGHAATVMYPDPTATQTPGWQTWQIPFANLAGVNMDSVESLCIGVGNPDSPTTGGDGTIFVDDISYGRPAPVIDPNEEVTE